LQQISTCTTTKEAWKELHCIYEPNDINTKRLLQKDFWSYKANEENGMANVISKFRDLID
jgi:hypothetical protein